MCVREKLPIVRRLKTETWTINLRYINSWQTTFSDISTKNNACYNLNPLCMFNKSMGPLNEAGCHIIIMLGVTSQTLHVNVINTIQNELFTFYQCALYFFNTSLAFSQKIQWIIYKLVKYVFDHHIQENLYIANHVQVECSLQDINNTFTTSLASHSRLVPM